GSDSSPLQTRYRGRLSFGKKPHLTPVGKPAPPRPRRPESRTMVTMSSGWYSRRAFSSVLYPPRERQVSSFHRLGVPMCRVRTFSIWDLTLAILKPSSKWRGKHIHFESSWRI